MQLRASGLESFEKIFQSDRAVKKRDDLVVSWPLLPLISIMIATVIPDHLSS